MNNLFIYCSIFALVLIFVVKAHLVVSFVFSTEFKLVFSMWTSEYALSGNGYIVLSKCLKERDFYFYKLIVTKDRYIYTEYDKEGKQEIAEAYSKPNFMGFSGRYENWEVVGYMRVISKVYGINFDRRKIPHNETYK